MTSSRQLNDRRHQRVAVASNLNTNADVAAVFARAVDIVAGLGHRVSPTEIPFARASTGIGHIERDRQTISRELFGDIDVVLLPTTTTSVPRTAEARDPQALSPENTAFANYFGVPAMTVPCGFDSKGLPVGLQIVAKASADLDVLTIGQQYEEAAGWFRKHPIV